MRIELEEACTKFPSLSLEVRSKSTPRLCLLRQSEVLAEKVTYLEEDFN